MWPYPQEQTVHLYNKALSLDNEMEEFEHQVQNTKGGGMGVTETGE